MKELFFSTILPGDTDLGLKALTLQQVDEFLIKHHRDIDWDLWFSIIESIANKVYGKSFTELDQDERMKSIEMAQRKNFRMATNIIVTCLEIYYTNPDVLVAIGASPTLPYEQGEMTDDDNWDILDPVSQRGQIFRDPR